MYNNIEKALLEKIIAYNNIDDIVDNTLEDKELTVKIIERVLVEQYIKSLKNRHQLKQTYYNNLLIEIDEQIKNAILINISKEQIYDLIIKVDYKIEAILFYYSIYYKITNYKQYIKKYISLTADNLSSSEIKRKETFFEKIQNTKLKYDKKLNDEEKKKLLNNAIIELKQENKNINVTTLSSKTKKHHTTIKRYIKQLSFEF